MDLSQLEERLRLYRANAEHARRQGGGMIDFRLRDGYLSMADSWDRLADDVEDMIVDLKAHPSSLPK